VQAVRLPRGVEPVESISLGILMQRRMPAGRYQTTALFRLFFDSSVFKLDSSRLVRVVLRTPAAPIPFFHSPTGELS
jgi:hypothetical protein